MTRPIPQVLITGATGGLGRALATAFCKRGYHTILSARDAVSLKALVDELQIIGEATGIVCDVADPDDLRSLGARIERLSDALDVVIVNAGQAIGDRFLNPDESLEQWRNMVLANIFGAAGTARVVLPVLVRARGSLVFIGSVTGRMIVPGDLYSVTKHAVSAMAEALRLELQDTGVQVAVIQPGLMDTPLVSANRRSRPRMEPAQVAAEILRVVSTDRPFDVNEVVLRPRAGRPA